MEHHPAVRAVPPATCVESSDIEVDFLGTRTRRSFYAAMVGEQPFTAARQRSVTPPYPAFDEEYFEWLDVLESVDEADDTYVVVELGAGYGRWCMRAAAAARRKGLRLQCVAVEPEPDHFRWMLQHFRDNGIDPGEHELVWAAVAERAGFMPFWMGNPSGWYGQKRSSHAETPLPDSRTRRRLKARSVLARPPAISSMEKRVMWVPCITVVELLASYSRIDLIDVDVQRAELDVLAPAIDLLTDRVKRIHIGTHTRALEEGLRELFGTHGWSCLHDYPCHNRTSTPYGEIEFGDGVQTWINPRLARSLPQPRSSAKRQTGDRHDVVHALRRQVGMLKERNRELKADRAKLRARCRALDAKLAAAVGSRPQRSFRALWQWLTRRMMRT